MLMILTRSVLDSGTVGTMGDADKVFVLASENKFFNDWSWNISERCPKFFLTGHLSCARGFLDLKLAESFQRFLKENGHDCQIRQVERGRLVRRPDSKVTTFKIR